MSNFLMDNPVITAMVFFPRHDQPGASTMKNAIDGTIPVENDVVLGYRLYPYKEGAPVVLYFHGNGEIASDYDSTAPEFHRIGASLLVVDYRAYGWSTGKPRVSKLMEDVEPIQQALSGILAQGNLGSGALFVMGRSLGSISAIQIASQFPQLFKGLIIESGIGSIIPWLMSRGIPAHLFGGLPDPIGNIEKMKTINLPLLVIHGERDTLLPITHGQGLFEASPSPKKRMLAVPNAGHNDLLYYALGQYFAAIQQFMEEAVSF